MCIPNDSLVIRNSLFLFCDCGQRNCVSLGKELKRSDCGVCVCLFDPTLAAFIMFDSFCHCRGNFLCPPRTKKP